MHSGGQPVAREKREKRKKQPEVFRVKVATNRPAARCDVTFRNVPGARPHLAKNCIALQKEEGKHTKIASEPN